MNWERVTEEGRFGMCECKKRNQGHGQNRVWEREDRGWVSANRPTSLLLKVTDGHDGPFYYGVPLCMD